MTSISSPQPISPLRACMIEDMTVRGFKNNTRRDYVRHVRAFAAFIGRSPDTATAPYHASRRMGIVGSKFGTVGIVPKDEALRTEGHPER